jgi:elongator complex protein 1
VLIDQGEGLSSGDIPGSEQGLFFVCPMMCFKCSLTIRSTTTNKVNSICDALRQLLESQDLVKYVETILTTHACKQPPDYESGLRLLLQLQGSLSLSDCTGANVVADHAEIVEDAVKYIIFLSDVNKLYDVALGMYNFQLVLMVAQYSQKVGTLDTSLDRG